MERGNTAQVRPTESLQNDISQSIHYIHYLNLHIMGKNKDAAMDMMQNYGETLLKNYDLICYYLSTGAFLKDKDYIINYPLNTAAHFGDLELFESMVSAGFDPRVENKQVLAIGCKGDVPLIIAAKYSKLKIIRLLIEKYDVSPNIRNREQETPLHLAASGRLDIVKYLVDKGADVNALDRSGFLPLNNATHRTNICRYLIENGTDMELLDEKSSIVPLMCASRTPHNVIKMLLENGASVNKMSSISTCSTGLIFATKEQDLKLMKLLHQHGADPDLAGWRRRSPLHIAAGQQDTTCARYLIVNMDARLDNIFSGFTWYDQDRTPFSLAVDCGNVNFLNLLLDVGYNPRDEYCLQDESEVVTREVGWKRCQHENSPGEHTYGEPLKEVMKRARYIASNPLSLRDLCCGLVRGVVKREDLPKLNLPAILRDRISFRNLGIEE